MQIGNYRSCFVAPIFLTGQFSTIGKPSECDIAHTAKQFLARRAAELAVQSSFSVETRRQKG